MSSAATIAHTNTHAALVAYAPVSASSTSNASASPFDAVYACLNQANTRIATVLPECFRSLSHSLMSYGSDANVSQRAFIGVKEVVVGVLSHCATIVQQMVDVGGILDIMNESEDYVHSPTHRYIPSTIGETFKYTELPGSDIFFHAQLVRRVSKRKLAIKHLGIDKKYGSCSIDVAEMDFVQWSRTNNKRQRVDVVCV